MRAALLVALLVACGCNKYGGVEDASEFRGPDAPPQDFFNVLVFTRTTGFRHDSIEAAASALYRRGNERGWAFETTEDPVRFTDAGLAEVDAVVFLLTTG